MIELNKGLALDTLNDRSTPLTLLETRRSASAKAMTEPGPSKQQVQRLLNIAVRVPDHGKLTPWRFILFEGDARERAGRIVAVRYHELHPGHGEQTLQLQRDMFSRAPCVIGVVSTATADHPKIPEWEQVMSAGAVCQNMLIAATAMELGAQWISGWFAYDRQVLSAFGLSDEERIAGFVYLGTPVQLQEDRPRPEASSLTTQF